MSFSTYDSRRRIGYSISVIRERNVRNITRGSVKSRILTFIAYNGANVLIITLTRDRLRTALFYTTSHFISYLILKFYYIKLFCLNY